MASAKVNAKLDSATGKGKTVKAATVKAGSNDASNGTLDAATVKLGKQIWSTWRTNKLYVALGIREKTATGTGTRAAMLAVAAFGYVQGNGRVLAMAVRQAMGLNPNVGGIDFPWLEKPSNIATITSSAAIRPDAKDGKMRLLPITVTRKASPEIAAIKARRAGLKVGKANTAAIDASKATNTGKSNAQRKAERSDGPVTVGKMSAEELATLQG